MGLLPENSLLPVTANAKMLAQALKARQQPRNQLTGQGLLDTAAIGLSPVPVIGDALGLAADASRYINDPSSRTPLNFGLTALGLIPFVPPLVSAGLGKFAQSQGKTLGQLPTGPARNQAGAIVYHGSPHKFDAFDSSKIGTGEGAQAYGHGLYFAENPAVAQEYQRVLAGRDQSRVIRAKGGIDTANKYAQKWQGMLDDPSIQRPLSAKTKLPVTDDWLKAQIADEVYEAKRLSEWANKRDVKGSLYKVDLPDEAIAKMLDWDKPLSQQSKEVQKAIADSGMRFPPNASGKQIHDAFASRAVSDLDPSLRGNSGANQVAASDRIRQAGIPGIRYLDGGSRGAGQGTSNYVVFPGNEGLLKILERQ